MTKIMGMSNIEFERVGNAPPIDQVPKSVVTEGMVEYLNEVRMGLTMTGRGRPEDVPEAKVGDPLLPLIRELISGGDIGPVSGMAIAESFAGKSGMSKEEFNANIREINELGKARRGGAGGIFGKAISGVSSAIGWGEGPMSVGDWLGSAAKLAGLVMGAAAIGGAVSGNGVSSAFGGGSGGASAGGAGSAGPAAAGGKTAASKASTGLLKNPKTLAGAKSAAGGGAGGFSTANSALNAAAGASGGSIAPAGGGGLLSKAKGFLSNPLVGSTLAGIGEGLMQRSNMKDQFKHERDLLRERHELTSSNYRGADPSKEYRQAAPSSSGVSASERFGPSRYAQIQFRYDPVQGRIVREPINQGAA